MKNSKQRNKIIVSAVLVLMIFLGVLLFPKVFGNNIEDKYKQELKTAATDFYENFYYGHIAYDKKDAEVKDFLERFSDAGIKVDLDNLARFEEGKHENLLKKIVDPKTKETCDLHNTRVIILPKAPFNKTDYDLDVELDCGLTPTQP